MTDHAPSLATEDEARDLLGADTFKEAFASGRLRRVVAEDGAHYIVGADIDRVQRENDPARIAARVRRLDGSWPATNPDDDQDSPAAIARRLPRL